MLLITPYYLCAQMESMSSQIQQDSINDLLSQLNAKIDALVAAKANVEEGLKALAAEIGVPVGFCALPGCGRVFVKTRRNKAFCCSEHKSIFDNKYRRM